MDSLFTILVVVRKEENIEQKQKSDESIKAANEALKKGKKNL